MSLVELNLWGQESGLVEEPQLMKTHVRKQRPHLCFQHPEAHRLFGVHAKQQVSHMRYGHSPFLRKKKKAFLLVESKD